MATRLYIEADDTVGPSFYQPPVSFGTIWDNTANARNCRIFRDKNGFATQDFARSKGVSGDMDRMLSVWISGELAAQTIAGTARAVARVITTVDTDEVNSQIVIRVMSPDLQAERGVLYAGDTSAFDLGAEWVEGTHTNRFFPKGGAATLTEVECQEGDRIIVELGFRTHGGGGTGTQGKILLGDGGLADLPDNETNQTAGAPWIEFSQDLAWREYPHGTTLASYDFTAPDGSPWP